MDILAENTRKQVYLLSLQDFLEHPIWAFCLDEESVEGQDEAMVKPSADKEVPGYSPGAYVVAADITYANGTRAVGYIYSGPPDDFGCIQPNILLSTTQVNLWLGSLRFRPEWKKSLADSLELLGDTDSLFPMSFETRASVNGAPLKITIEGFQARDVDGRIIKVS